jgi:hypothetical protein
MITDKHLIKICDFQIKKKFKSLHNFNFLPLEARNRKLI